MKGWLLIFLVLAGVAQAQEGLVRSGNHPGFARLVISFPKDASWQVGRNEGGFAVRFDVEFVADTSEIFDRIPRDRIETVAVTPRGLDLVIGCDCHADAFLWQEGRLVIDIIDGPATPDNPFELALGTAQDDTEESMPKEQVALPLLPYWPEAASSPLSDMPDTFNRPEERAWIAEAEGAVLEGIAGAASAGLLDVPILDVVDMIAEVDGVGVLQTDLPTQIIPGSDSEALLLDLELEGGSPGIRVRDATTDPDSSATLGSDHGSCLPDEHFLLSDWADSRPFAVQIAEGRGTLTGEFDRYRQGAIEQLAMTYLHFGFGQEALDVLRLDGARSSQRLILEAIADVIDDRDVRSDVLRDQINCVGSVSLWALLANGDASGQDEQARIGTVHAFRVLPTHLRGQLGPRVAGIFLKADDPGRADAISLLARQHAESGDIDADLTDAEILGALEGTEAQIEALEDLAENNSRMTPGALAELLDLRRQSGAVPDTTLLDLADSLLFEARADGGHPELAIAAIMSHLDLGNFAKASELLEKAPFDAAAIAEISGQILLAQTATLSDAAFLSLAFTTLPDEVTPDVENAVAARVLELGFPERAADIVKGEAEREALSERRYLRGAAYGDMGEIERMESALAGLMDERAETIRLKAYSRIGEFDMALERVLESDLGDPGPLAWRAGALSVTERSEDPVLAEASGRALETVALNPDLSELAAREALLLEASETRQLTEALLNRFPFSDGDDG